MQIKRADCPLLQGVAEGSYVYFVHSYYVEAGRPELVAALGKLLKECDERAFAPVAPPAQPALAGRALVFYVGLYSGLAALIGIGFFSRREIGGVS